MSKFPTPWVITFLLIYFGTLSLGYIDRAWDFVSAMANVVVALVACFAAWNWRKEKDYETLSEFRKIKSEILLSLHFFKKKYEQVFYLVEQVDSNRTLLITHSAYSHDITELADQLRQNVKSLTPYYHLMDEQLNYIIDWSERISDECWSAHLPNHTNIDEINTAKQYFVGKLYGQVENLGATQVQFCMASIKKSLDGVTMENVIGD